MKDTVISKLKKDAAEFLQSRLATADADSSASMSLCLIRELLASLTLLEDQNQQERISKALLKQESEFYQDVINNLPVGIYRIHVFPPNDWCEKAWHSSSNPPYKMELANNRFCDILGVTRQQFDANPYVIVDLICADDKNDFIKKNEEANINLTAFSWQGRLIVNQKLVWVRLESHPRLLTTNDILWTGFLYDITEKKRTEEALIATRLRLDDIVEAVHVGIVDLNIETDELIFNHAYPKMLGYTFDEFVRLLSESTPIGWRGLIHLDDLDKTEEAHNNYLGSNLPYYEYECRLKHKNGHWVWMHRRASITGRTFDGKPLILSSIHTDISRRKQLEMTLNKMNKELESLIAERTRELEELKTTLQLTEEKYCMIADFSYDWEYWISKENEIIYMSPSVERITGYKVHEFVENPTLLETIISRNDRSGWHNYKSDISGHLIGENSTELNFRIIRKDGKIRWIGHMCRSINVDGVLLGVWVSNRDITDKVEAKNELLQVAIEVEERERNRFSSELHDEMGPLLSIIKLYFQWLSETTDVEKMKMIIQRGNESIENAIQSARELARGLSSQLLIKYGYVNALIHFTERINEMQKININFAYNCTDRFSWFLEMAFYRITTELIKNTLTYASAANIKISFHYDKDRNTIIFVYTDDGIGFDWLEVVKTSTGLGLKNIQNRVQLMKAELVINSSPGNGMKASFKCYLDEHPDANLLKV